ncbi:MAG: PAS domain S-box protein [Planctomycetaceae bacterium]|nr:PAS domain S-box protein [Planctomycetaceae bacterium]
MAPHQDRTHQSLQQEIERLQSALTQRDAKLADQASRLAEAEELLRAIREGDIDGLVLSTSEGQRVFTLQGADRPYQVIVEQMQEGALTVLEDGWISYSNRRFAEMTKRPLDEIIGSRFCDHVTDSDRPAALELFRRARDGAVRGEVTLTTRDGGQFPVQVSLGMVVHDGQPSMSAVITDLSERKWVEQVLASERFVRSILNQAADGIVVCDPRGRVTFANDAVRDLAGGNLIGMRLDVAMSAWGDVLFPDGHHVPANEWSLATTLRGKVTVGREIRLVARNGRQFDVLANASPIRDAAGAIIGAVATYTDISGRKRAEEAERQQREWLHVTLTSIGDAVIATDMAARVTLLNPVAAKLTGWDPDDAAGQPVGHVFRVVDETTRHAAEDAVARVLQEKRVVALGNHAVLLAKDGREVPVEDSAAPIIDPSGNLLGVVLVFHDVTAKRQAEEQIRKHVEQLRASNEELALFNAAMVDRELRMIELKKEVNDLCQLLGQPRRYPHGVMEEQT